MPSIYPMGLNSSSHPANAGASAQLNKTRTSTSQGSQLASRIPPALTPITNACIQNALNNGVPTNVITSNSRQQRTANAAFAPNSGGEIIDLSSPPHSPINAGNHVMAARRPAQMANNIASDYNSRNDSYQVLPPLVPVGEMPTPHRGQQPPFKVSRGRRIAGRAFADAVFTCH